MKEFLLIFFGSLTLSFITNFLSASFGWGKKLKMIVERAAIDHQEESWLKELK